MPLLLLLLLVECGAAGAPPSPPSLGRLVSLDRQLVREASSHVLQLEEALTAVREYVAQVSEVYGTACSGGSCSESLMEERVLGNPIYNYQLLKRVTVYWANVEKAIGKVDGAGSLARMRKIKKKVLDLPTESDLVTAARRLNRLAEVYDLPAGDLVAGVIQGQDTGATLGLRDTYYLARTAALQEQSGLAVRLLEEAVGMAGRQHNSTANQQQVGAMQLLLLEQRAKVSSSGPVEEHYLLGQIPAKTSDWRKLTTPQDKTNFQALCRGRRLLAPLQESRLTCYYSSRDEPYLLLQPVPVEVLHAAPHEVLLFHDVLSPGECRGLAALAARGLKQSAIGQGKELSDIRVSRNAWLEDGVSPLVDRINRKTNRLTGLQTSVKYDRHKEGKKEEFEYLQVAEYGIGGHYNVHQDPMFVYKEPTFLAKSVEAVTPYLTGDRMSTLMYYLSDVTAGGVTAFPRLGVAAAPLQGAAIFWHNLKRSGAQDMAMLHGGCPVLLGTKMVANKWMREVAQTLHRPCGLTVDS